MKEHIFYIEVKANQGIVARGSEALRKRKLDELSKIATEELRAEKMALFDKLVELYMREGIDPITELIDDAKIRQKWVDLFIKTVLSRDINVNIRNCKGQTLLMFAAAHGSIKSVKSLLQKNADVDLCCNHDEMTPLIYAAKYGKIDNIKELILAGANIIHRVRENSGPLSGAKASDVARCFGHFSSCQLITDVEKILLKDENKCMTL